MIDAREEIDGLVAIAGRGPGTDAERRAAQHLRGRLETLGRQADTEGIWIRPRWALAHAIHAVLGIVASICTAAKAPGAGAIIAAVALASTLVELGGRLYAARLATGRRGSQNVVSREDGDRPGTLVLVAHYDAPRASFIYGRPAERLAAVARRLGRSPRPFGALIWPLAAILLCASLRNRGIDPLAVDIVQFAATVALILAVPVLLDIALSDYGPAAADNASGVATVLRLAERYGDDLEHFDVWVLLTGGQDALADGMREWMRRHKEELDPARTVFVNVDAVGAGTVRYTRREGPLLAASVHPRLIELAGQIAEEDAEERRYAARPMVAREPTDGLAARRAGFPAISVTCRGDVDHAPHAHTHLDTPDRVDDGALERAFAFCSELIELIDERIGPDVAQHLEREREGVAGGG